MGNIEGIHKKIDLLGGYIISTGEFSVAYQLRQGTDTIIMYVDGVEQIEIPTTSLHTILTKKYFAMLLQKDGKGYLYIQNSKVNFLKSIKSPKVYITETIFNNKDKYRCVNDNYDSKTIFIEYENRFYLFNYMGKMVEVYIQEPINTINSKIRDKHNTATKLCGYNLHTKSNERVKSISAVVKHEELGPQYNEEGFEVIPIITFDDGLNQINIL